MAVSIKKLTAKERSERPAILSATAIQKGFGGVEVLHRVDFELKKGEIHGLAGANGAGKSTLMKILSGVHLRDGGEILIHNVPASYTTPIGAREAGISMVFQEFSLIPTLTVAQNIFLAKEPCRKGRIIDYAACVRKSGDIFTELGVNIDPEEYVENLAVGNQQIVEIAKALSQNASILILDEPTASLSHTEIESLFHVVRKLRDRGISIIIVTHHLQEIMDICDWITVLRDGHVSLSKSLLEAGLQDIIEAVIGRAIEHGELGQFVERGPIDKERVLLEVKNLSIKDQIENISFKLHAGEILGIAGVLGSGRTELLKTLYGILPKDTGEITLAEKPVKIKHPADAQKHGVSLVPENRHKNGIITGQSLRMNILLPVWKRLTKGFWINDKKGKEKVYELIGKLKIKTTDAEQLMEHLSGGNQQKVVIAKSIIGDPGILLLDDPTVGVDVGSKQEILHTVSLLAKDKKGIVFVSSEFEELANLCDRVLIIRKGRIIKEFDRHRGDNLTEGTLLGAAQENDASEGLPPV